MIFQNRRAHMAGWVDKKDTLNIALDIKIK